MGDTVTQDERLNAYYCESCRGYIVTVDRDKGVTPMFLACRVKGDPRDSRNDCRGQMRSMMYPKQPWPETDGFGQTIPTKPTWEWFKPTEAELAHANAGLRDHIERGGLDLRQIRKPAPPPSPQRKKPKRKGRRP